ncbi:MAG TPA: 4Fe-4S dicluster domain-containing protein [Planctomycetota bacterium]|nr:4Fe-4S dicluster domain-containing protein [Planctomycetota bacterium]
MRKPKLRELGEAIKAVFCGPYTSKFPAEPSPAPPAYRGQGQFDEDECVACGGCARVCPSKAIDVVDQPELDPPTRTIVRHDDRCVFCGQCEAQCLTGKGVHLTNEYELSTLDRSTCEVSLKKELALCEICGAVIAAKAHLRWVARKLGAKRFANPTLVLTAEGALQLTGPESARRPDVPLGRSDIVRVLCPTCRRAVVVSELWG